MVVYKYLVIGSAVADTIFNMNLPKGAKILTLQIQDGTPVIWALVDPKNPLETRTFAWLMTGENIALNKKQLVYINTLQIKRNYVVHLFEIKE